MKVTALPANEFDGLRQEWDRLAGSAAPVPILEADFVACCVRHFATPIVELYVCEDGSDIVGMLFLQSSRLGSLETWVPSQAPLGLSVVAPDSSLTECVKGIFRHRASSMMVSVLQLDSLFLPPGDFGPLSTTVEHMTTPWIECSTSFETFWEGLGSNIKRNMRKDMNKLAARGIEPTLSVIDQVSGMAQGIVEHGELESSGWKGSSETAISADNAQGRFYSELLQHYAAKGRASIYQYHYGDLLVASDFAIEDAACVVVLKTAYHSEEKGTSPAQLLRYAYLPMLFERLNGGRIEFYGRTLEWHKRWTKLERPISHLEFYRSGAVRAVVRGVRSFRN